MGSSECTPTCENGGIDKNSAQCSPTCENGGMTGSQCQPKELPATGAETALGGLFGTSALAGAGYYYRNSRKNLISKMRKMRK
jgi:LPXTG-motif cell wall-anchored protein